MTHLLNQIVESGFCLGCGLCASLAGPDAVRMEMGADGFPVPRLLRSDADLGFLRDLCPGITIRRKGPLRGPEKIYGPYTSLHRAYAKNDAVRWKASSGGAITAVLIYLLENKIVDAVLHIGKSDASPLHNAARVSRTREEAKAGAGSRYAPGSLLEDWMALLRRGERIAVVGKPCDIVAVRQFLDRYPEFKPQVVCTLSFMCMGLPSQRATTKLVEALGVPREDIRDFWYRGNGWPGKATAVDAAGGRHEMSYQDSWGRILSKEVKFRCKVCPDGYGEFADLSCGDAWDHDRDGRPLFDERPGMSAAFVRTETGRRIFEAARNGGYLGAEPYDVANLETIQRSQYQRKIHAGVRLLAVKLAGDRLLEFTGFAFFSNLVHARISNVVRNLGGTFQRYRACRRKRS